jgi:hypothetical protein
LQEHGLWWPAHQLGAAGGPAQQLQQQGWLLLGMPHHQEGLPCSPHQFIVLAGGCQPLAASTCTFLNHMDWGGAGAFIPKPTPPFVGGGGLDLEPSSVVGAGGAGG